MAKQPLKPGTPAPVSGQYQQVGPRGGDVGAGECTSTQGHPLPPTQKPGNKWVIADPTKHK